MFKPALGVKSVICTFENGVVVLSAARGSASHYRSANKKFVSLANDVTAGNVLWEYKENALEVSLYYSTHFNRPSERAAKEADIALVLLRVGAPADKSG